MEELKEYILEKLTKIHIKINYRPDYENNTHGDIERATDRIKFETLRDLAMANPEWDKTEFSKELSARIKKRTNLRH